MIGRLPRQLNINGVDRAIRSDFRDALLIFQAFDDIDLKDQEKSLVMLTCLYENFEDIPSVDYKEAMDKGVWFLDGGDTADDKRKQTKKVIDWKQDEQMIFSAINKVAGYETRAVGYVHLWTFLGLFNEIGEGLFSTTLAIRIKQSKGKALEKNEKEFYIANKNLVDLKVKYTAEEQAERDYWENLLG